MSADDPDGRRRLKDNAAIEHRLKGVPRRDHAPPGHVGMRPALVPAGPGGLSSSQREFRSRWRSPELREQSPERALPIAPPSNDDGERRFKFRDDAPGKERPDQGRAFRQLDRGDLRRDLDRER